jgi:hypothetical protein
MDRDLEYAGLLAEKVSKCTKSGKVILKVFVAEM